jgi:riboflavin synthase
MFAGIVKGRGRVLDAAERNGGRRFEFGTDGAGLGAIAVGDSIAVNGVCLTATSVTADAFTADASAETLSRSTLRDFAVGREVNLESSLRLGDTIDGHLVYGHVDGVGHVVDLAEVPGSVALTIEAPAELMRYFAVKGSVTVDGVSLTVNAVAECRFRVNIIPHTREITVISAYASGTPVNIEVDMIARYLERLVAVEPASLSLETLQRHGFA